MFDCIKKERVAQVLLRISHLVLAHLIHFWHGQTERMEMTRHIDERAVLIAVRSFYADDRAALLVLHARVNPIGSLLFQNYELRILALKLKGMMNTGYLARRNEILQYSVGLYHDMLAVVDLDLLAYNRIDEGQFGQTAVV